MFYTSALLDEIERVGSSPLQGATVFRHMLGDNPPSHINTRGARWNPPDVAAIYLSFARDTALAEADYYLSLQTPPIRARRMMYRIIVSLQRVTDLRDLELLSRLGVRIDSLTSTDWTACQRIGGAVARLGCDGLIIPSIRQAGGVNLVIFPTQHELETAEFQILDSEMIPPPTPKV